MCAHILCRNNSSVQCSLVKLIQKKTNSITDHGIPLHTPAPDPPLWVWCSIYLLVECQVPSSFTPTRFAFSLLFHWSKLFLCFPIYVSFSLCRIFFDLVIYMCASIIFFAAYLSFSLPTLENNSFEYFSSILEAIWRQTYRSLNLPIRNLCLLSEIFVYKSCS